MEHSKNVICENLTCAEVTNELYSIFMYVLCTSLSRPTNVRCIYIYIYMCVCIFLLICFISEGLLHVSVHFPEDDADALKHVGVLTIYKIYMYIQGVPRVKVTTSGECSLC